MSKLLEHYEYLHANPELSRQEFRTAEFLTDTLVQMGYAPVRAGKCGVYADLVADPNLPWVLLRSDMDALPVTEETGVPYASRNPGVMHACGHDSHMAMLLAAAGELKEKILPQNIRFLFQPAEEGVTGAVEMVAAGVVPANTAAVFGMHVWPDVPKGKVMVKAGPLMASTTTIQIRCRGLGAHCGNRERGRDALMTMAQILVRSKEAESLSDGDGSVLFFGKLQAGTSHNIVASEAAMNGTLRTYYPKTREKVLKKLEEIAAETAAAYGTEAEVIYSSYAPAVINPESLAKQVQALLPNALTEIEPTRIAEDFSRYQEVAPGVLMWLGVGDTPSLHNGKFLVPKEVLPTGVDAWVRLAEHKW
ncbi:MAG: amidohydrolase [Oscillospiraceae bacterium]|nr:amidohydrolase [Oscillospiraceae bacterium]